jgi:hypothetical protein
VKKLTKFFGDEPPLLRLFLKNLGYEKFAATFEEAKIGLLVSILMTLRFGQIVFGCILNFKFWRNFCPKTTEKYLPFILRKNSLPFKSILMPYEIIITNINLTISGIIHKFRPNWFHKINSRNCRTLPRTG